MRTTGSIKRVELSGEYDDEFDDYEDDFLSGEMRKTKKDKKKKKKEKQKSLNGTQKLSGVKQMLAGFNARQTKNNWNNTALKTIVDLVGIGLGTTVSATTGKAAPLVAAALIGAGHYIGDESGLMRVVGASTLAHSVAKAKEYRQNPDMSIADRLKGLKDDWLYAAMLKHYNEQQKTKEAAVVTQPESTDPEITQSDLEGLDLYTHAPEFREEQNQLLREFEQLKNDQPDYSEDEEMDNYDDEESQEELEDENEFHTSSENVDWNDQPEAPFGFSSKQKQRDNKGYYSQEELNRMLYGDLPDLSLL